MKSEIPYCEASPLGISLRRFVVQRKAIIGTKRKFVKYYMALDQENGIKLSALLFCIVEKHKCGEYEDTTAILNLGKSVG
jgi:hypothetical protein